MLPGLDTTTTSDTLPDFSTNPRQWDAMLRIQMKNMLKAEEKISNDSALIWIVNATFRRAGEAYGNTDGMWAIFRTVVEFYWEDKGSLTPPKERILAYAKQAALDENRTSEIIKLAAPRGSHTNTTYYFERIDEAVNKTSFKPALSAPAAKRGPVDVDGISLLNLPWEAWDAQYETTAPRNEADEWFGEKRVYKPEWKAIHLMGAAAEKEALKQFRENLSRLKSVIYIEGDIKKALGGLTIQAHSEQFGMIQTCQELQDYLDMISEQKEFKMPQSQPPKGEQTDQSPVDIYMQTHTTMAGVRLCDIKAEFNKSYANSNLFDMPANKRQKKGAKGVKPAAVHARVTAIFGMETIGWRFVPCNNSHVNYTTDQRESKDKETGEITYVQWHIVSVDMYIFQYRVMALDGTSEWLEGSPLSDIHENMDKQSARRGAMSSLLKQQVRRMGGFEFLEKQSAAANQADTAALDRPAQPKSQGGTGLTGQEQKALMVWADGEGIPRKDIFEYLGLTQLNLWTAGYEAAQKRVLEARKKSA